MNAMLPLWWLPAVMAMMFFVPSHAAADPVIPMEVISGPLPFYDPQMLAVREPHASDTFAPMRVLLSRSRYWQEDGHLDVVVRLNPAASGVSLNESTLVLVMKDAAGDELSQVGLRPAGENIILYPAIPQNVSQAGKGSVELRLLDAKGKTFAAERLDYRVDRFLKDRPASMQGEIELHLSNESAAIGRAIPMSVGVPLPRGVLKDASQIRLMAADEAEAHEIPIEVTELARWSKFGSIKWLRVDFTLDLKGRPRKLVLQYGPQVKRSKSAAPIIVQGSRAEDLRIDLGRLKLDQALWFDVAGDDQFQQILKADALDGAFVNHADGRVFKPASDATFTVESAGPVKVVLRREGWYVNAQHHQEFCRFITRYILYKDSPVVQIFHTWIFTGDGNKDAIANMGWGFPLAENLKFQGFPKSFAPSAELLEGRSLLQWDYDHFDVVDEAGGNKAFSESRAPGVAMFGDRHAAIAFGSRDFWQSYPAELEADAGMFWFHNWPRNNRPAGYTFEGKLIETAGGPAKPSAARHQEYQPGQLSRSEWTLNLLQIRFAHEGKLLSFRLPDQAAQDPIVARMKQGRPWNKYWRKGEPESINAQGISRTEELWLVLSSADEKNNLLPVIQGLNDQTLRVVVDPAWVTASEAFYEIHPQDWKNFPQEERAFEQLALSPGRWQEHLGLYGKWIYGDITGWDLGLDRREPALYRAFRKRHHGWPYSWVPYVRSGDARLLRLADAATRRNIDVNWRHYATDGRKRGLIHRSTLPWASTIGEQENATRTRDYESKADYLLHAWYVTGYHRAWDLLVDWMQLTRRDDEGTLRGPIGIRGPWGSPADSRFPLTMLKSYLETYEATFDPWFLVASHEIAKGFDREFAEDENYHGTHYVTAYREFHRYTGSPRWAENYLRYVSKVGGNSMTSYVDPLIEPHAYAWKLTGNPHHLGRLKHLVDWMAAAVWMGQSPEHYQGFFLRDGGGHTAPRTTGWMLQYFPLALRALHDAGGSPLPIAEQLEVEGPASVLFEKSSDRPVILKLRQKFTLKGSGSKVAYVLTGPSGFTTQHMTWESAQGVTFEIPADAPQGVYRLDAEAGSLVLPLLDATDAREVIQLKQGQPIVLRGYHMQLWFMVPQGMKQFTLNLSLVGKASVRRVSVWSPDGQCVWDFNYHRPSDPETSEHQVKITVPPGQADGLWRIALPASDGASFTFDERIPPFYTIDRSRWFDPANSQ